MSARLNIRLSGLCLLIAAAMAGSGAAYAAAGHFQFVSGEVKVIDRTGLEREARKGESLDEGDTIITAQVASAQVRMVDGGFIAIRPDSRMKLETFAFNGRQDGTEKSIISLIKGGFRAITGLIGKLHKDNYQIQTPGATIGIRGTDHEPMYIPQPQPGTTALGVPGTYDRVNHGAAYIKTDLGIVHINPNQVGFAAGVNLVPQLLPKIPNFYKQTPEKAGALEGARPPKEMGGEMRDGRAQSKDAVSKEVLRLAPVSDTRLVAPTTLIAPSTSTTLIAPSTSTTLIAPTTSTTLIAPSTSTTLIAPTTSTTLIAPTTSTTLIAPITSTTLIAPTTSTTLIAPITSTTTLPLKR